MPCDDIEDRKIAGNPRRVHERCEKITRDLMQAFHKDKRRLVICNNLSTKEGVVAHLMAQLKPLKNTFVQRVNLTTPTGQSNWPQYFTPRDIQDLKETTDAITLQSEYYNNPIERGRVFKREWVRYRVPDKTRLGSVGCWDLSYTKQGDYKAFALVSSYPGRGMWWRHSSASVRGERRPYDGTMTRRKHAAKKTGMPLLLRCHRRARKCLPAAFPRGGSERAMPSCHWPYTSGADKYLRIEATLTAALQYGTLAFHEALKGTRDAEEACSSCSPLRREAVRMTTSLMHWKWHCAGAPDTSQRANRCSKHQL